MNEKILIDRSVAEQALKALEKADRISGYRNNMAEVKSLIAALEQPQVEQKPVAWQGRDGYLYHFIQEPKLGDRPLYAHPQPPRQPLTDEQIIAMWEFPRDLSWMDSVVQLARAVERAHRIGGEA